MHYHSSSKFSVLVSQSKISLLSYITITTIEIMLRVLEGVMNMNTSRNNGIFQDIPLTTIPEVTRIESMVSISMNFISDRCRIPN